MSTGATLETYVSVLRRRIPGGRNVIATVPGGYHVVTDAVSLDLDEFDRLVRAATAGEGQERYGYLAAAAALGREPVLAAPCTFPEGYSNGGQMEPTQATSPACHVAPTRPS